MRDGTIASGRRAWILLPLVVSLAPTACRTKQEREGAALYARMCAVCHGPNGEGYKADQAPNLRNAEYLASASDALLRDAIANGRLGSTMSAWGRQSGGPLFPAEVDAVIAFMRLWHPQRDVTLDERPPAGDRGRGSQLYFQECARCHGARGLEGPNARLRNPGFLANASNGFMRLAIANGRAGTLMLGFAGKLGPQGIDDLLAFIRNWTPAVEPPAPRPAPVDPPPLPLGKVVLNPRGPAPVGFRATPDVTPAAVIKAQLDRHAKMAILDARAPSDYLLEHIPGAVSVPFYDPKPYFDKLPRDVWLVCYCACPHAESGQLAEKLKAQGFTKVTVLDEGLGYWRSQKFGTELAKPAAVGAAGAKTTAGDPDENKPNPAAKPW
ncbi:MAG TPA: c-type cytochrome [Polyangia bacterium]|nr:c-type cytochrome [Polyangia bacterium]